MEILLKEADIPPDSDRTDESFTESAETPDISLSSTTSLPPATERRSKSDIFAPNAPVKAF